MTYISIDSSRRNKTSILFNLDFTNNIISLCFFFFFLIIDLFIDLIIDITPAVITQIFNPIAELLISIGIPSKEQKLKLKYIQ